MSLSDKLKSFMQQKENDNLKAGEVFLAENGKREISCNTTKRFTI